MAIGLGVIVCFFRAGSPLLGDIEGDGKADPIVVDSSENWCVWFSGTGYQRGGPYALNP